MQGMHTVGFLGGVFFSAVLFISYSVVTAQVEPLLETKPELDYTSFEETIIQAEQEDYRKMAGQYFSSYKDGISSYIQPCEGYFIDDGQGQVTGYGDLADNYTFTYELTPEISIPSSTPTDDGTTTPIKL